MFAGEVIDREWSPGRATYGALEVGGPAVTVEGAAEAKAIGVMMLGSLGKAECDSANPSRKDDVDAVRFSDFRSIGAVC